MTEKQKKRLYEAVVVLRDFCELNSIPKPKINFFSTRNGNCGYYTWKSGTISVDPNACAREVQNPAMRSWSHPHYFTDRTIYGVLHHEFGHYVHELLGFPRIPTEKKITSYEPDGRERFAETIKLFLGNPDLLREYDPKRYEKLISLGLKPLHQKPWKEVMLEDGMNEKFVKRANEKIAF